MIQCDDTTQSDYNAAIAELRNEVNEHFEISNLPKDFITEEQLELLYRYFKKRLYTEQEQAFERAKGPLCILSGLPLCGIILTFDENVFNAYMKDGKHFVPMFFPSTLASIVSRHEECRQFPLAIGILQEGWDFDPYSIEGHNRVQDHLDRILPKGQPNPAPVIP